MFVNVYTVTFESVGVWLTRYVTCLTEVRSSSLWGYWKVLSLLLFRSHWLKSLDGKENREETIQRTRCIVVNVYDETKGVRRVWSRRGGDEESYVLTHVKSSPTFTGVDILSYCVGNPTKTPKWPSGCNVSSDVAYLHRLQIPTILRRGGSSSSRKNSGHGEVGGSECLVAWRGKTFELLLLRRYCFRVKI